VTEVDTGRQHVAHAYLWHFSIPTGLGLHTSRSPTSMFAIATIRHPGFACRYMCDVC